MNPNSGEHDHEQKNLLVRFSVRPSKQEILAGLSLKIPGFFWLIFFFVDLVYIIGDKN